MIKSIVMLVMFRSVFGQIHCEDYLLYTEQPSSVLFDKHHSARLDISGKVSDNSSCWESPSLSGNFYCFWSDLAAIPKTLPARTKCLIFCGNNLRQLQEEDISHLINLEVLFLDFNPLVSFKGDFSRLPLQVLSMQDTNLKQLVTTSLPLLTYYAQTNAMIGSLQNDSLSRISKNLQYLKLSNCSISESDGDTFKELSSLKVLDLSYNNFTTIPSNLPPSIQELRILDNFNISEVHAGSLKGLPNLQNVSITAATFATRAFENTPNLLQLKLQACHVQSNATSGLTMIRDFVVYKSFCPGRKLYLEPYPFIDFNEITAISMDRISIATIPTGLFYGARKLKILYIDFDNIDSVQDNAFSGLPRLQTLQLTNNFIPVTTPVTLSNRFLGTDLLESLTRLDLSDFRIDKLVGGIFDAAPNLVRLYMGYNMMTAMEPDVFGNLNNLKYITLYNNPWRCDCHLRWLKNLTEEKPGLFYSGNRLECDQPQELHGKYFDQLDLTDFIC